LFADVQPVNASIQVKEQWKIASIYAVMEAMLSIAKCQVDGPPLGVICDTQPNIKREFPARVRRTRRKPHPSD
jgi:hypothetical protein